MKTVYKVVLETLRDKKDPHNIRSTSAFAVDGWAQEYPPGRTVTPALPGSFLYAFETLNDATKWLEGSIGRATLLSNDAVLRVYEAQAEVMDVEQAFCTMDDIERFWKEQWWLFGEAYPHVLTCPAGTLWCAQIKITEVVFTDQRTLRVPMKKPVYR